MKQFLPSVLAAASRYRATFNAPIEVIVVDDGSKDETQTLLREMGFSNLTDEPPGGVDSAGFQRRLLLNNENVGFNEACNRGFAAARYPLVFLLNNDVEVNEDCLGPLVENFRNPSVFAAHCRVFHFSTGAECGTGKLGDFGRGFLRVHGSYAPKPAALKKPGDAQFSHGLQLFSMFASGGSAMFDRQKWNELGGFEPLLAPAYWEDVEISYRAWKRGYLVLYEPRSIVRHRVSSTLSGVRQWRVQQRNRLIFNWIHLHDARYLFSNICWVMFLALTAPIRLQASFLLSCWAALTRLPQIRRRRRQEKRAAKRSDREVLELFSDLRRQAGVMVYGNHGEEPGNAHNGSASADPSLTVGAPPP